LRKEKKINNFISFIRREKRILTLYL